MQPNVNLYKSPLTYDAAKNLSSEYKLFIEPIPGLSV